MGREKAELRINASAKERMQHGKSRRDLLSRAAQAHLHSRKQQFDAIDMLRASTEVRIPQLLSVKYERMKASPFAFFRGAVSIMAADLGRLANSGLQVQLCGDAHVQNLGSFATPDGKLVFDLNDFDETIRGPWEWDVKRMAASIVLAGQEAGHDRSGCKDAAEVRRELLPVHCEFAELPILQMARHQIHREKRVQPIEAALRQSERARSLDLLKKLTRPNGRGLPRFRDLRPSFWRIRGQNARDVLSALGAYRKNLLPERRHLFDLFRSIDVGFKIVGTGSVGLRDYVVFF